MYDIADMIKVFPAPAGINRASQNWSGFFPSVPRASGDKPLRQVVVF
ncbi:hypothetical protein HA780_003985 [Salmonella enterica]|nr:hypothetical protein [Salmonella enterica]